MISQKSVTASIDEVVASVPGWTPPDELLALYTLALSTGNLSGGIVELGSWCGRSTVILGLAAQQLGNPEVTAIDLFPELSDWFRTESGNYSFKVDVAGGQRSLLEVEFWAEPFQRDVMPIYETFGSVRKAFDQSVEKFGVQSVVTAHRGDSQIVIDKGLAPIRLAFIDADHSYEAVRRDIEVILPRVAPGGWIAFDDAHSGYDGVDQAIKELVETDDRLGVHQQLTRKLFAVQRAAV